MGRLQGLFQRHWQRALRVRERIRFSEEAFHLVLAGGVGVIGGLVNIFFYHATEAVRMLFLRQPGELVEVAEKMVPWQRVLTPTFGGLCAGLVLYWGLRMAGPNCLGLANVKRNIWPTASSRTLGGLTGPVGLICQSGATAFGPFLLRAVDSGIGLSYIISTGNETDLDFTDFARYLLDDPDTRVIAGFIEGFKDANKFLALAELAAERSKPIVLIKIGRSESGARAARSHTAALTGAECAFTSL